MEIKHQVGKEVEGRPFTFFIFHRVQMSKGAKYKLRGQIAQNVLLCQASSFGFSKMDA